MAAADDETYKHVRYLEPKLSEHLSSAGNNGVDIYLGTVGDCRYVPIPGLDNLVVNRDKDVGKVELDDAEHIPDCHPFGPLDLFTLGRYQSASPEKLVDPDDLWLVYWFYQP